MDQSILFYTSAQENFPDSTSQRMFSFSWHLNLYFKGYGEMLAECFLTGLKEVTYMRINGITAWKRSETTRKMLQPNTAPSANVFSFLFYYCFTITREEPSEVMVSCQSWL